ncbi:MAG: DUF2889 domain-containing protein [Pseudomonadota bacterium]
MPLPPPKSRQLLHRRQYDIQGFLRDDGLFDIEAHMHDQKDYDFTSAHHGKVEAGMFVHDMLVRLTMDAQLQIHAVDVAMDSTPFRQCPMITGQYQNLVGERIAPGWTRRIKKLFASVQGCTHVTELLIPMATVAIQTIFAEEAKKRHAKITDTPYSPGTKSRSVGGCHALDPRGAVVKELWPEQYRADAQS